MAFLLCALACLVQVRVDARLRSGEEVLLDGGQVRGALLPPVERLREPDAAVELAVGLAHGVPGVGSHGKVTQDPLALGVVLEPLPETWPGVHEGLVRQHQHAFVAGQQPSAHELLDDCRVLLVVGDQRRGTRLRTGAPSGREVTRRSIRSRTIGRLSPGTLS